MAVVSAFFYTHAPLLRGGGGVKSRAMQHPIRRIMLNYCANPLISMTYKLSELPQSHASHANHNI